MQFTKCSSQGAYACRSTWRRRQARLQFTLYPMWHIASSAFYRQIAQELVAFDYILYEGVSWRERVRKPVYDLAAKNLGLVCQEDALALPAGAQKINIDMPRPEFRERFQKLPRRHKLLLIGLRPLLWLLTKLPAVRKAILSPAIVDDTQERAPGLVDLEVDKLLLQERDAFIRKALEEFYRQHAPRDRMTRAAIVFGAQHMIAIGRCLRALSYRAVEKQWLCVIAPEDLKR